VRARARAHDVAAALERLGCSRARASGSGRRCARRGGRGLGTAGARAAVGLPCSAGACGRGAPSWCGRGAGRGGRRWRGRAVPSRRRGRGERERRGRRGQARRVGERREEGRGKGKEKKRERKWEKEKKRKRRGEKREKERGGEGSVPGSRRRSRSLSATLGVRARESATRGSRKNRVLDTGVGSLGNREIWRNREDSGNWG